MPSENKICLDCKASFELTEGEIKFFAGIKDSSGKPFNPPKRCKACRIKRKIQNEQSNKQI